ETLPLAENVHYVLLEPVLSTNSFRFLDNISDHTDLAPIHPGLLGHLRKHQVLHTTDAYFSLAKTAEYFTRWAKRPLVSSIHTDTPSYTRIYSDQVLRRLFGNGLLGRALRERWHCEERLGAWMQFKLGRHLRRCDWAMASKPEDMGEMDTPLGRGRFSVLRRGIDKDAFHPRKRDRHRLKLTLSIKEDRLVLLFAGRVDQGKDVMTLARGARILLDRGAPVHVILAGEGSQATEIRELLGNHVTLTGPVPQSELTWLYASADLFVFPSQIEISPNVVVEARASGIPVLVSSKGGSSRFVHPGRDALVVSENDSWVWAEAIDSLRRDPQRRAAMGEEARRSIESEWPSWHQVLTEDLLPIWRFVARERDVWG
ncbi:MAG TPA: glycosyltransferase, partial [Candidatus Acidoferrales bacterium]|nr:glycosyltransferase [Candidatus Acidoferrales bacterium]